jgi:hypothetical protein
MRANRATACDAASIFSIGGDSELEGKMRNGKQRQKKNETKQILCHEIVRSMYLRKTYKGTISLF